MRLGPRLAALAVLIVALGPAPRASAAVPVLVIDGKGFGHGVGMAQDGAFWMGKAGATTAQILEHFYPGTRVVTSGGTVRVAVLQAAGPDATLAFPNGGEVRDAPSGQQSPGFPVKVSAGGQVRVHFDGARYFAVGGTPNGNATALGRPQLISSTHGLLPGPTSSTTGAPSPFPTLPTSPPTTGAPPPTAPPASTPPPGSGATTTTTAPATPNPNPAPGTPTTSPPPTSPPASQPPPTTAPPPPPPGSPSSARPLWAVPSGDSTTTVVDRNRTYRGMVQAVAAGGALRLVDQLDVEQYLKGMGEVRDPSWPLAALQSQAIAARTYALRAMQAGGEICDDQRCQVYLGAQAEYGAMNKAVDTTAHQVLAFGSGLASTVYSANAGGFSASRLEGFGATSGDYPYLQPAPYTTGDPMPWTVKIGLPDLAARFGYAGTLTGAQVSQAGPSGRALTVELDGSAGPQTVQGIAFAAGLGLKSTLFAVHVESADVAPPPPQPAELIQTPPDQAAQTVGPADTASDAVAPPLDVAPLGHAVIPGHAHTAHSATAARAILKLFALLLLAGAIAAVTPKGRRFIVGLMPSP